MSKCAVEFLQDHGASSLVSLGCGQHLNRMDNHIRLMLGCGLRFYVGIDRVADIEFDSADAFVENGAATALVSAFNFQAGQSFDSCVRVFPETRAEQLDGIHCAVVVCQRVLPFKHWEHIIESMRPLLVLQEDLHGCELQEISGKLYTRTRAGASHYQLIPFRPWRIFPGERNLILWRRRDFLASLEKVEPGWLQLYRKLIGKNGGTAFSDSGHKITR